jgi:hypothetical protein
LTRSAKGPDASTGTPGHGKSTAPGRPIAPCPWSTRSADESVGGTGRIVPRDDTGLAEALRHFACPIQHFFVSYKRSIQIENQIFRLIFMTAQPGSPIYKNGMLPWTLDDLASDVKNGTLPQVCRALPPQAFSEPPGGPSGPLKGSSFTEQVLNALTTNTDVWSKIAFFLTFDENDGLFATVTIRKMPRLNRCRNRATDRASLPK